MITLPAYIEKILERLLNNGYDSYVVGGSIRDSLMNKTPVDWDIASLGEPDEIMEVFSDKKVIKTGEKYGTLTIIDEKGKVEITTFRSEGNYLDGRHPDWVQFEKNIETDLGRRDFTINALAYNKEKGLIDPYKGAKDIKNRIIRAVGNPVNRFTEDKLRMIRAVRFSTSLNFEMDVEVIAAIKTLAEEIKSVSNERIKDELIKILMNSNSAKGVKMLLETGLLKNILPEADIVHCYEENNKDYINYKLCLLNKLPNSLYLRLAALFLRKGLNYNNTDKNLIEKETDTLAKALKGLCFSKEIIYKTIILIKNHGIFNLDTKKIDIKKIIRNVKKDNIYDLITLLKAKAICSKNELLENKTSEYEKITKEILNNNEAIDIEDLNIKGNDIIKIGFKEGIIIGDILEDLLEEVLKYPQLNKKELLINMVERKWHNIKV